MIIIHCGSNGLLCSSIAVGFMSGYALKHATLRNDVATKLALGEELSAEIFT